eukprot:2483212-Prymnesium_polylepis.2
MHPVARRPCRAHNCGSRARLLCCCCCCCCCCWHAAAAAAAATPPIPPGGHQPPGATPEHTGARTPSCPRSYAAVRTQQRNSRARHSLPGPGQTSRGFLSASRARDAQRAANNGQQAKGLSTTRSARQGKVRQRVPIGPQGAEEAQRVYMRGWVKGSGWGFLRLPLLTSHLVPGALVDGQQQHLRQKLAVD